MFARLVRADLKDFILLAQSYLHCGGLASFQRVHVFNPTSMSSRDHRQTLDLTIGAEISRSLAIMEPSGSIHIAVRRVVLPSAAARLSLPTRVDIHSTRSDLVRETIYCRLECCVRNMHVHVEC